MILQAEDFAVASSSACISSEKKSCDPVMGVTDEAMTNEEQDPNESNSKCNEIKLIVIAYEDPAKWPEIPEITDSLRTQLVNHGPETVDLAKFQFPTSNDGRHLDAKWFFKILRNGERVKRQWMIYSQSKDALFCFPCLIFCKSPKLTPFSDFDKGFQDWKHLNPCIQIHENSSHHRDCYIMWKDFERRLRIGKTLDAEIQSSFKKEIEKWRNILKVVVDVIIFCAQNNLALRGGSRKEIAEEPGCGIFLSTLKLISHYHPQLAAHMAYMKANKQALSYFFPIIQNELIELIAGKVKDEILRKIKAAKYFSIMFDCTPDSAQMEHVCTSFIQA